MKACMYLLLACASLALMQSNSCNNPPANDLVTINYTPVGNTDQTNASSRLTTGMYMRFHIDGISNQDTSAASFSFDPQALAALPGGEHPMTHVCFPTDNAQPITVPAGQTSGSTEIGSVTIETGANQPSSALQTVAEHLSYITNSHVKMVSSNTTGQVTYYSNPCSH